MAHNVTQQTLQTAAHKHYLGIKSGKVVLLEDGPVTEHAVFNVEQLDKGEVAFQDPIHKQWVSINAQGQIHLEEKRDKNAHFKVVHDDAGNAVHGVVFQAFHNCDGYYLSVSIAEPHHLGTRKLHQGDRPTKAEWFQVEKAPAMKEQHHHAHAHHGKDHQ